MIWYEFYCDESNTHGRPDFWLGGLCLTLTRRAHLRNSLVAYKRVRPITFELKWTNVSNTYLSPYQEFVDILLNDVSATFIALHIEKGTNWRTFGTNEEERFFKSYYVFFKTFSKVSYRYDAFQDYKTTKWYRWQSLQFALNGSFRCDSSSRGKRYRTLRPVDSKTEVLLQITDILLGALQYQGSAGTAKGRLAQHVRAHLSSRTQFQKLRIKVCEFSPRSMLQNQSIEGTPTGAPSSQILVSL